VPILGSGLGIQSVTRAYCKPGNLTRQELLETWTRDRLGRDTRGPQTLIPVYKGVLPCLIRSQRPVL
jgi:hypothetical protein